MRRRTLLTLAAAGVPGMWFVGCSPAKAATPRRLERVLPGTWSKDGAGVKLLRLLGSQALRMVDPFLLLDRFGSSDPADYLAGFPKHPHRGFETVTVLLDGTVDHQDSVGNRGSLQPGGLQWMTAGRGIVHEEMPKPDATGTNRGLQLWVNLPAAQKWNPPRYQDVGAADVPVVERGGARVRVLAGDFGGREGPVSGVVIRPLLLDVTLGGGRFEARVPGGHTVLLAGLEGAPVVGPDRVALPAGSLGLTTQGDRVAAEGDGRFLLCAGAPLAEPVARRGPFVMNTDAELEQAWADWKAGRLTERAGP
jgi:redox-sensitive bicupin YhaK (pirin superfamily)